MHAALGNRSLTLALDFPKQQRIHVNQNAGMIAQQVGDQGKFRTKKFNGRCTGHSLQKAVQNSTQHDTEGFDSDSQSDRGESYKTMITVT